MERPVILELKNVSVYVNRHTTEEIQILKNINLKVYKNDFITLLGSNGAGKSTLFNIIAGNQPIDEGQILVNGHDISNMSEEKRTKFISRVFQDPKLGTAPRMTVAENLLLATKRGNRRNLKLRRLKQHLAEFKQITATMPNRLSERLKTPTGNLSGGQRQALSFLMATIKKPAILLLDEHTAALDPKTSAELMEATQTRVTEDELTALMITHQLSDAVTYGNRLLVMKDGRITQDLDAVTKANTNIDELMIY
ncbi:ABC transporter ATP-binding protein [Pediococcus pentosaceus]|uniref:ABC transporter ATP-binding protein n=1 Tax=Pediococcus pentosaceus TaxID=1255 RepID=UPI0021AFF1C2|nr:ATP-binding cassette domain-containing protein [Pediococcus pentosaceus]MCT1176617.1 ATP-binding cassette domain-containing protein [Pediococcus pentosaceus]